MIADIAFLHSTSGQVDQSVPFSDPIVAAGELLLRERVVEPAWSPAELSYAVAMEFGLLGPLRVRAGDGSEIDVTAAKVRTLLALLLVHRGRPVVQSRIIDALWGEQPPRLRSILSTGVRDLRRALGHSRVESVAGGYRLDTDGCTVDLDRFTALADAGRHREAPPRSGTARRWPSGPTPLGRGGWPRGWMRSGATSLNGACRLTWTRVRRPRLWASWWRWSRRPRCVSVCERC